MGIGIVDDDRQIVADLAGVAFEDDDSVAVGAASELEMGAGCGSLFFGGFAGAFDQNLNLLADEGLIVGFADFVLKGEEFVVAVAFDFVRDIVGKELGAFGAGAFAVFEDEAVFEAALADEVHRELELGVGLAAEADDEVTADSNTGHPLLRSNDHLAIVFDRVAALHPHQNIVRTALRWNVQILTDFWQIPDSGQEIVRHVLGIVRDKLDAFYAVDCMQAFEQVAQSPGAIPFT